MNTNNMLFVFWGFFMENKKKEITRYFLFMNSSEMLYELAMRKIKALIVLKIAVA